MQINLEYRGHYLELSTVDLECAECAFGIEQGDRVAIHRDRHASAIDHPHTLTALRLGRWTVVITVTGVNPAWHSEASTAARVTRAMSRTLGNG